jgi:hypothetical protein
MTRDVTELPPALTHALAPADRTLADRWWSALDDTARHAVRALTDRRLDTIALAPIEGEWHELSIELRGRVVDPEDAREDDTWCDDLIEYINGHPEVAFHLEERRFHICRAHRAARDVISTGRVPARFTCPAANDRCPFKEASSLASGRPLVLTAILRGSR